MATKKSWRPASKITAEQMAAAAEAFVMATSTRFEYYKASDGWRWRLIAGNNRTVASGEGYGRRTDCLKAIALVQSSSDAMVREVGSE
jgi:uncharacterized protein YegP (UPF0339 family)